MPQEVEIQKSEFDQLLLENANLYSESNPIDVGNLTLFRDQNQTGVDYALKVIFNYSELSFRYWKKSIG